MVSLKSLAGAKQLGGPLLILYDSATVDISGVTERTFAYGCDASLTHRFRRRTSVTSNTTGSTDWTPACFAFGDKDGTMANDPDDDRAVQALLSKASPRPLEPLAVLLRVHNGDSELSPSQVARLTSAQIACLSPYLVDSLA